MTGGLKARAVRSFRDAVRHARETGIEVAKTKTRRSRSRSANKPVVFTRARLRALAVIGVAWALLSPQLGAAILPSDTISNWWRDWRQSDTEEAVERYVDEVQDAAIWAQPPKIYESSVTYFEDNYEELDPTKVHEFPGIDTQPLPLGFLATEAAGWTGEMLLVSADVQEPPRLIAPVTDEIGSYRIALRDHHVPRTGAGHVDHTFHTATPLTLGETVGKDEPIERDPVSGIERQCPLERQSANDLARPRRARARTP